MSGYFELLDEIQAKVYENLRELVKYEAGEDQSKLLVVINKLLIRYREYLKILNSKVEGQDDKVVLVDIYQNKLVALRNKVRSVQLKADELKNEKIHQERIQKYHLDDKNKGLDNEIARDKLFAGRSVKKTTKMNIDEDILSHNKKITSSLQMTRQLMSTSILQTELNVDSLDQQTKDLKNLNEEYIKFGDLLARSKGIVKFIEKQDKHDKRRIYMALGFFAFCCVWVIWRRILRTPVRLFLWSVFKVFGIVGWMFGGSNKIDTDVYNTLVTSDIFLSSPPTIIGTASEIIDLVSETTSSIVSSLILEASEIISELEDFSSISTIAIKSAERIMDEL